MARRRPPLGALWPCGPCPKVALHKPPHAPHRSLVPLVATGVDEEEQAISGESAEDDNQQPDEDLHARHRSTPMSVLRATLQQGRIRNSTRLGRDSTARVHIRHAPAHILLAVTPSAARSKRQCGQRGARQRHTTGLLAQPMQAGRRHQALRHYQALRVALQRELGVRARCEPTGSLPGRAGRQRDTGVTPHAPQNRGRADMRHRGLQAPTVLGTGHA
jgi:hypothetical protein